MKKPTIPQQKRQKAEKVPICATKTRARKLDKEFNNRLLDIVLETMCVLRAMKAEIADIKQELAAEMQNNQ